MKKKPSFIFVSGGVISGLGKGITTSSIALLLKSQGFKVAPIKCDMYLNVDAGTMNPLEHGEIFVTSDGAETDQDLGHYERFLNENLTSQNYITAGQVYKEVLEKERSLGYNGKCVEAYIHIPEAIIKRLEILGKKADIVIVEFGGTVGEYQNVMFFEAARRMKIKYRENVLFVHIGYLPIPASLGEMKTKPIQQSIHQLNELGVQPDIIVCRAEKPIDEKRRKKVAFAATLDREDIFSNPDLSTVYEIPIVLQRQKLTKRILEKLGLSPKRENLTSWQKMVRKAKKLQKEVKIAIVAKYYTSGGFSLEDSYVSVVEAVKHACWASRVQPKIIWFDSQKIERLNAKSLGEKFKKVDGLIIPQGWGSRGVEGKIRAIRYARENKLPYLGLCFGMQMAVIEFARNVLGFKNANSTEVNPKTKYPVIHIMPEQKKYLAEKQYGGTIRLGSWKCRILKGTNLAKIYGKKRIVSERHRHRYEFNNEFRNKFEKKNFRICGLSPDNKLVEAIEITNHPFFVGTQFHPEYQSRPLSPHPLFVHFVKAAMEN